MHLLQPICDHPVARGYACHPQNRLKTRRHALYIFLQHTRCTSHWHAKLVALNFNPTNRFIVGSFARLCFVGEHVASIWTAATKDLRLACSQMFGTVFQSLLYPFDTVCLALPFAVRLAFFTILAVDGVAPFPILC